MTKFQLFQETIYGIKQGIRGEYIDESFYEEYLNKNNKRRKKWFINIDSLEGMMRFVKKYGEITLYQFDDENQIFMNLGSDSIYYPDDLYD